MQKTGGTSSARVSVTTAPASADARAWRVALYRPLASAVSAGTTYTLTFRARADRALNIRAWLQAPDSGTQYLGFEPRAGRPDIALDTQWRDYQCSGVCSGSGAARFYLGFGGQAGSVWVDDVRLQTGARPDVWRRDFTGGVSLVNPTDAPVTVSLGATYRKIKGTQDPLVNDGSLVTKVTLPPKDGLVVLRPAPGGTP